MNKTETQRILGICLVFGFTFLPFLTRAATRYVDINSTNPVLPYISWETASTNIQLAVMVSQNGDLILVNDGVYQEGTLNSPGTYPAATRVLVNRAVAVRSLNGPEVTLIVGSTNTTSRVRSVYLIDGASLSGFTLTNGAAQYGAGGVECASASGVVSNCLIVGNLNAGAQSGTLYGCVIRENGSPAFSWGSGAVQSRLSGCLLLNNYSGYRGGGAGGSYLTNCVVMGNYAGSFGGGLDGCTALNCTIVGNTAWEAGGGASGCRLTNCIVYYNSLTYPTPSPSNTNIFNGLGTQNTCTTPIPSGGVNCFTTPPLFVNQAAGNLHLQSNSPCLNTGNNLTALPAFDKDGRPRIVESIVDVGAYEYQGEEVEAYMRWLADAGLPIDSSSDSADNDADGANNWQEWRADTVPTNAASVLRIVSLSSITTGLRVVWQTVPTRHYWLERASDLSAVPSFQTLFTNLPGLAGTRIFNDVSATNDGPYFYRVGVH